jgi:hypothetical protein
MNSNFSDRFSFRQTTNWTDLRAPRGACGLTRPVRFLPGTPSEEDAAYQAAIEAGDFNAVLGLLRKAARKADMIAQAAWLFERAIDAGYRSVEELVQSDGQRFEAWAAEWRQAHPFTR